MARVMSSLLEHGVETHRKNGRRELLRWHLQVVRGGPERSEGEGEGGQVSRPVTLQLLEVAAAAIVVGPVVAWVGVTAQAIYQSLRLVVPFHHCQP